MLVNSISSFNTSKVAGLKTNRNENCVENTSFTGLSMSPTHKKISLPLAAALMLAALGLVSLASSCSTGGVTNGGSDVPATTNQPNPPTPPTVTQSPVQTEMLSIAKILGLSSSTKDIIGFSYTDGIYNIANTLTLNKKLSSDNELVYDGTALNQDLGTTNYVRHKITKTDNCIIVKEYNTKDGKPLTDTSVLINYASSKYVLDNTIGCVNKYSINDDGTVKQFLATISPESDTSLLVTDADENMYELTDILITTK